MIYCPLSSSHSEGLCAFIDALLVRSLSLGGLNRLLFDGSRAGWVRGRGAPGGRSPYAVAMGENGRETGPVVGSQPSRDGARVGSRKPFQTVTPADLKAWPSMAAQYRFFFTNYSKVRGGVRPSHGGLGRGRGGGRRRSLRCFQPSSRSEFTYKKC